ncbi:MAG: hypothetical protein OEX76_03895 [Candidatus Bathyarchaeota archaeon]|nr:hypothetical protein [Candidatus Bathyarchaeota archaeon]
MGELEPKTKRVALATIFGAVIFISKTFLPSPIDKMFTLVHALLLALGALLLGRMGATYIAAIGGALTALLRTSMAPFTLVFALSYGLLVDVFFFVFKINTAEGNVKTSRLVASMTISTALLGVTSYYTTVFVVPLLQRNPMLELGILVIGTVNGIVAGYFASVIWNRYLKNVKF